MKEEEEKEKKTSSVSARRAETEAEVQNMIAERWATAAQALKEKTEEKKTLPPATS